MRRLLAAAFLAFALTGTVEAVGWRTATVSFTAEGTLRWLINAEHLRVCGKSLAFDTQLVWAARFKAQDIGYRDRMLHTFVDGTHIWDFYAEAGIPKPYGAGEILAVNNYPDAESPAVAFRGWMGSAGHRAIIRNCDYDRFGIGAFKTLGSRKWYAGEFTNTVRP